jgi:hypothetical protein
VQLQGILIRAFLTRCRIACQGLFCSAAPAALPPERRSDAEMWGGIVTETTQHKSRGRRLSTLGFLDSRAWPAVLLDAWLACAPGAGACLDAPPLKPLHIGLTQAP